MQAHPDLTQSNLWQIPVPEQCINKTFEYLFNYLLDRKLVTMALYRLRGSRGNQSPYVFTNPESDTIITHRDRAFVLGINIPEKLHGDDYERMAREGVLQLRMSHQEAPQKELNNKISTQRLDAALKQSTSFPRNSLHNGALNTSDHRSNTSRFTQYQKQNNKRDASELSDKTMGQSKKRSVAFEAGKSEAILGIKAVKSQSTQIQKITEKLENSVSAIETIVNKMSKKLNEQNEHLLKIT